ncbi:hypothetical protein ACSBR1_028349 [Camellia fascicularis]
MDNLPYEIMEDILSRLPIKSLIRFRCVSKSWLSLTHNPYLIKLHFNRSSQENPSLILTTTIITTHFRAQLYLTDSQRISCNNIRFSQPNFNEFRILGSCNGLLFLVHRLNSKSILSATHVLLLNGDLIVKKISGVFAYNLGGGPWRYVGIPPLGITGDSRLRAFLNGVLHWTIESFFHTIICFDVTDEVFQEIPSPAIGLKEGDHSLVVLSCFLAVIKFSAYNCIVVWIIVIHLKMVYETIRVLFVIV